MADAAASQPPPQVSHPLHAQIVDIGKYNEWTEALLNTDLYPNKLTDLKLYAGDSLYIDAGNLIDSLMAHYLPIWGTS